MIELALLLGLCATAAPPPLAMGAKAPKDAPAVKVKEAKPMEWKGQYGGQVEPGHRVISDAKAWSKLWRMLGQEAPTLDFTTHQAVAVFLGEKPTGGWTAAFEEPVAKGGDLHVSYAVRRPTGFVTQAFTQPYHVRAFPRPKGKLVVVEKKEASAN